MKKMRAAAWFPLALLIVPSLVDAAYYYEAKSSVENEDQVQQGGTVRGWVDGENARVEFEEGSAGPMVPAGSYLISNDGGQTLYVVDPKERTVSEIDLAHLFQMVGNIAEATKGVVKIEFSDFSSEKLAEEPGQPVLGYPTTHYRFKTGYTMNVGVLGFTRSMRTDTQLDLDCSPKVNAGGFKAWLRPDRFRTGNDGIDKLIAQQYSTLDCTPLRNRAVTTTTDQKGHQTTTTSIVEVTTLREEAPPSDAFTVPADYTKKPLIPDLSSTTNASGNGQSTEPAADDAKKRPRLRDLLRH